VEEGIAAGLVGDPDALRAAGVRRAADPSYVPDDVAGHDQDTEIGSIAAGVALRRHAGRAQVVFAADGRVVERSGKDLREVDVLVGSGGVLRHGHGGPRILERALGHGEGGWQLPERPRIVVDHDYVLAAAGLLVERSPDAAHALLARLRGGNP
jgi:uncharacterized protein (TIGR01319 family)